MPPALTREQEIQAGLIPPPMGEVEPDRETRVTKLPVKTAGIYRRRLKLNAEDEIKIKALCKTIWDETQTNTTFLRNKLKRWNDLFEGVRQEKTFPWKGACSTHVPLIEIHLAILHTGVVSTILDNDPVYYVRTMVPGLAGSDDVDPNIEWFLNWVCKVQLKMDTTLSEIIHNAFRDPLACGCLDWVEELKKVYDIRVYSDPEAFLADFPEPKDAGVSEVSYRAILAQIASEGQAQVKVEERVVSYRGPRLRVVELKDLIVYPATSPTFEYAQFVGDQIRQRVAYFENRAKLDWFDKDEVEKLKKQPGKNSAIDSISSSQDRIEGVGRSRQMPDEYDVMQGILKYDFNGEGDEQMYMVVYNPDTDALLRFEDFPYIHNRNNYIPFRTERKSNRLLGRCVPQKLEDINEEVDTSHHQRIDSRTIATVPSFKKIETADFDPTRADQKFFPGVTFKVRAMTEVQQFDIRQTDLGESMQEESNLFGIAEQLDGASMLRSGRESQRDPRAPAKKIAYLLQQSNVRIDTYIKELRIGMNELAAQILELYYQFSPETVVFPIENPDTQKWVQAEIVRSKFRNNNMSIDIAHTSVTDNPDTAAQRAMIEYQLLSKEPLIGSNIMRRYQLVRDLVIALRRRDVNKLVPPLKQFMQELQDQNIMNHPAAPDSFHRLHDSVSGNGKNKGASEANGMRQGGPDVSVGNMGGAA